MRLHLDRGLLPRWLAVLLGLRKLSPGILDRLPGIQDLYSATHDTSGGPWRPTFRPQPPWEGGSEPAGGDSNAKGEEHCWNQCTLCSASVVWGWHEHSSSNPKGGVFRHEQGDLDGGTDLYDARDAWDNYNGADLKIKSGQGWGAVQDARRDWRAIVLQGTGNTPGAGTYTGAHAIGILPERPSSGSEWLIADPLCDGYDWVPESKLKEWAQAFSSGICFAVSRSWPPDEPEPAPEPEPEPEPPPPPPPIIGAAWAIPELPVAPWDGELWDWGAWSGAWGRWGPGLLWRPIQDPTWELSEWPASWAG